MPAAGGGDLKQILWAFNSKVTTPCVAPMYNLTNEPNLL